MPIIDTMLITGMLLQITDKVIDNYWHVMTINDKLIIIDVIADKL